MDKKEIKKIMAIARPAVWAIYGRQQLTLTAYNKMGENCLWIELENIPFLDDARHYKLRIEDERVTYLNLGQLG